MLHILSISLYKFDFFKPQTILAFGNIRIFFRILEQGGVWVLERFYLLFFF